MIYCVHGIHRLPPLVAFAFNPMAIQICEQAVDIVGAGGVARPLSRIVS